MQEGGGCGIFIEQQRCRITSQQRPGLMAADHIHRRPVDWWVIVAGGASSFAGIILLVLGFSDPMNLAFLLVGGFSLAPLGLLLILIGYIIKRLNVIERNTHLQSRPPAKDQ